MKAYKHYNTSKMFVRITVYALVVCYHAQRKWEKGNMKRREGSYLHEWHVMNFLLNLACLPLSGNVGQCVHVSF